MACSLFEGYGLQYEVIAMADVILYGILSLAALYTIYRVDPEHSEVKYI